MAAVLQLINLYVMDSGGDDGLRKVDGMDIR